MSLKTVLVAAILIPSTSFAKDHKAELAAAKAPAAAPSPKMQKRVLLEEFPTATEQRQAEIREEMIKLNELYPDINIFNMYQEDAAQDSASAGQ